MDSGAGKPVARLAIRIGAAISVVTAIALAAVSPLLQWRDPVYIAAGFAGIFAMSLLLAQPLLMAGRVTTPLRNRTIHRWVGLLLTMAVMAHVAGLWLTSPPDVIDALLLRSPTSFSLWGVIAMWAVFASALLALAHRRRHLHPRIWRRAHLTAGVIIVIGTALHAALIEGTMEPVSKFVLIGFLVVATLALLIDRTKGRRTG